MRASTYKKNEQTMKKPFINSRKNLRELLALDNNEKKKYKRYRKP